MEKLREKDELKSCPFCGGDVFIHSYTPLPNTLGWYPLEYGDGSGKCYQVFCKDSDCQCGRGQLDVVGYYTQNIAIQRWNTRPTPPMDERAKEELLTMIKEFWPSSPKLTRAKYQSELVDAICSKFAISTATSEPDDKKCP